MSPCEEIRDVRKRAWDIHSITQALADEIYVGEQQMNVFACKTLGSNLLEDARCKGHHMFDIELMHWTAQMLPEGHAVTLLQLVRLQLCTRWCRAAIAVVTGSHACQRSQLSFLCERH